jgi:hypothetical protein
MVLDPAALAAIDEYVRRHGAGARTILLRLLSDKYAAKVNDAWKQMRLCRGYDIGIGGEIVRQIVLEYRLARLAGGAAFPRFARELKYISRARSRLERAARLTIEENPQSEQLVQWETRKLLWWLDERERVLRVPHKRFGFTRKRHGIEAQRLAFMRLLSAHISDIFGQPLDEAVAALTSVVFATDRTADQVRNARTGRRTKRTR